MKWKPIIVAVDDSPEAASAAALGWRIATSANTSCHLVHVVQDPAAALTSLLMNGGSGELEAALQELVGPRLRTALGQEVPPAVLERLAIRAGRTATMLKIEVEKLGAGLVVIGGKHHVALGRWLGGSTAHDAVRTLAVPVLVTRGAPSALRRVLVAVDRSYPAEPAIEQAERFARLADGQLRAIHVVEPLSLWPEPARLAEQRRYHDESVAALEHEVWPLLRFPGAEQTVRSGDAAVALAAEAADWHADVLVVGSHGKGWVKRALLGSVTEQLLNRLPVSLLVVPVRKPALAHAPIVAPLAARTDT